MSGFDYKAELDAVRARIIADTNRRCVAAWDRIHAETPGERAEREPVAQARWQGSILIAMAERVGEFLARLFGAHRE